MSHYLRRRPLVWGVIGVAFSMVLYEPAFAVVPEFIGHKEVGAVNGAMAVPAAFARAAAPFLASLLLSTLGNYRNVLAVLMAIALLALVSFWAATVLSVRRNAGAD